MTALAAEPARPHRAAAGLWTAAGAALALMPAVMAVAHRSSPLVISIAAVLALAASALDGSLGGLAARGRRALAAPLAMSALAFLAWSALSLLWSPDLRDSAHELGEFVLPLGAAFVLALALPGRVPARTLWLLAALSALSCISIISELQTGMAVRRALGMRWHSFVLNRPILTLAVLAPACLAFLAGRRTLAGHLVAGALAGLLAVASSTSESGASVLGIAAGAAAWAVARILPRAALALAALGIVAALATAPVIGSIVDRLLPGKTHEALASSHSRDRVDIWLSFGAAIREAPVTGFGFGSTADLGRAPVADRVPPERRVLLGVGHPHNAAVQVWAELGAMGAALAGAIGLLILASLSRLDARRLAPRLALLAVAAAVSLVGHGAWQGWWAASLGAAVVWFRVLAPEDRLP